MYTLHFAPDNASMIVRLVLEGAGLAYRPALVDRTTRQQDSPAYRALNPTGLIPTLETPAGPIAETAAILWWLGETHDLLPAPGHPDRAALLRWLVFISNTPHADLRAMFYADQYVPPDAISGHHAMMANRMNRHYAILDRVAAEIPALFTPAGLLAPYLSALMRWSVLYPRGQTQWFAIDSHPALKAMALAMEAAPQTARVARAEGLGDTPFTAPTLARPPQGSAT